VDWRYYGQECYAFARSKDCADKSIRKALKPMVRSTDIGGLSGDGLMVK
jgi:hypothetical protein